MLLEAGYRFFTFMILRPWLLAHKRGALVPEADTGTDCRGVRTDLLISGTSDHAQRHLLAFVASATDAVIREHFARTAAYIATHGARGTCITVTTVAAKDVLAIDARTLAWPSAAQRVLGVEALHVLHDVEWTCIAAY